jgi:hypothetical protein
MRAFSGICVLLALGCGGSNDEAASGSDGSGGSEQGATGGAGQPGGGSAGGAKGTRYPPVVLVTVSAPVIVTAIGSIPAARR